MRKQRWFACILLAASAKAMTCPIAIDVGHFREHPGAISARGIAEFEFNLALATDIATGLKQRGCAVMLIGADGNAVDLRSRTQQARGARFFLSVHHDSVQEQFLKPWRVDGKTQRFTDQFAGFSLFISRRNPDPDASLRCASRIGSRLQSDGFVRSLYHADALFGEARPFADQAGGVHYFDDLVVLKTATQPAVLLEAGVILNPAEEATLSRAETRHRLAAAVTFALLQCVTAAADLAIP